MTIKQYSVLGVSKESERDYKGVIKMKRIIAMLLTVTLIVLLAGCAGVNKSNEYVAPTLVDNKDTATTSSNREITDNHDIGSNVEFTEPVYYAIMKTYSVACSNLNPSGEYEMLYEGNNAIRYWTTFNNSEAHLDFMGITGEPLNEEDVCTSATGKMSDLFKNSKNITTVRDFEKAVKLVGTTDIIDSSSFRDVPSDLQDHLFCRILAQFDMLNYKNQTFIVIIDAAALNEQIDEDTWVYLTHL